VEFGLTREAAVRAVVSMVAGAASTMAAPGMTPEAVMDLIPVKPLATLEPSVRDAYVTTLTALHSKLKGRER
jgi:pyrroline-5-carboxylate reductase